jgi:P4 family phage/plasmid primase-like protien
MTIPNSALVPPSLRALPRWALHRAGRAITPPGDFGAALSVLLRDPRAADGLAFMLGPVPGTDEAIVTIKPAGSHRWPCYAEQGEDGGTICFARVPVTDLPRLAGIVRCSGCSPFTGQRRPGAPAEALRLSVPDIAALIGVPEPPHPAALPAGGSEPPPDVLQARGPITAALDDEEDDDEGDDAPTKRLAGDRGEIERFVAALFPYADDGTWVSLRAFHQFRADVPPERIVPVQLDGADRSMLIEQATETATWCATQDHPIVFAPPIVTFSNSHHARAQDLANGLVLSVELDRGDTTAAWARLEYLLCSAATVVMASGGEWVNPATGEVHPKLHLHWRLSEPTRTEDEHARLRQARDLAAQLVGGDLSAKPVVHPLRCPGSWNRKDERCPRMAHIIAGNDAAEIHLAEALEALQEAAESIGMDQGGLRHSADSQAPLWLLQNAAPFVANPDLHFNDWLRIGYAFWHATGGSPEGFEMFEAISQKSRKYNAKKEYGPDYTRAIWNAVTSSCRGGNTPVTVGAGTIFFLAKLGGWKRPPITDDQGCGASQDTEAAERAGRGSARSSGPTPEPETDGGNGASDGGSGDRTPPPDAPFPLPEGGPEPPNEEPPPRRGEDDDFVLPVEFSENRLAYLFSQQHAQRLVYVHGWGKWMRFDAGRWREDHAVTVFDEARKICAAEGESALYTLPERTATKIAAIINKAACAAAIERLARHHAPQVRPHEAFDADPMLLNGPHSLNIPPGRDQHPEDYCTKATTVDANPDADCPLWKAFLLRIMGSDQTMIDYLQRVCGYCLTGLTKERVLFFLWGTGQNGKTTFTNVLLGILGTGPAGYAAVTPITTFLASRTDQHPTDLAMLQGVRVAVASETEEGRAWAISKIKMMTGGDPITARFMRQDFFTYIPQFKIIILSNHKPSLHSVDVAIRSRFHLIPFTITIPEPERDKQLEEKLKAEFPAILGWMIEGCIKWQREGLNPPAKVRAATEAYLANEDNVSTWIRERCTLGVQHYATLVDLYGSWKSWAETNGEVPGSRKQLAKALDARDDLTRQEQAETGRAGWAGIKAGL